MPQADATVQYYTDQFRSRTSQQLRHAITVGLPWPEHTAAQAVLRERANPTSHSAAANSPRDPTPFVEVIRRILGRMVLLAFRVFMSAQSASSRRLARIPDPPAISSVKILGNVPSTKFRSSARVGERPHKVSI